MAAEVMTLLISRPVGVEEIVFELSESVGVAGSPDFLKQIEVLVTQLDELGLIEPFATS